MEKSDLLKILNGDIDLIDRVNVEDVALFEVNVTIYPKGLKKILTDFLSGAILCTDLVRWAQFICLRTEYSCPDWESESSADYYEDMMYVIQRLSTPSIDGDVTRKRVESYLSELQKYTN